MKVWTVRYVDGSTGREARVWSEPEKILRNAAEKRIEEEARLAESELESEEEEEEQPAIVKVLINHCNDPHISL